MSALIMIFLNAFPSPNPESYDLSAVEGQNCSICSDEIDGDGSKICKLSPCNHVFHILCIKDWIRKTTHKHCPDCRQLVKKVFNYNQEIIWGPITSRFVSRNWRFNSSDVECLWIWETTLQTPEILHILWQLYKGRPVADGEIFIEGKKVQYFYNSFSHALFFHYLRSTMTVSTNPFQVQVSCDNNVYIMRRSAIEDLKLDLPLWWVNPH